MLSDVRRQKLTYLFKILDANKNGLLQPDDFVAVAEKISDILEYGENEKERLRLKLKALRLFVQLLTDLDKSDISIGEEEWRRLFEQAEVSKGSAKKYIFRTAAYIFNLFDQNEDRVISKEEYLDMFKIYDIDLEYSEKGFQKLDTNQDGKISLMEMVSGFRDFLMSSNPEAAGNWMFGDWTSTSAA
ncbi:EF-hand domain-containing protein [Marinoscillum pacificum]|uniref:EF-hand domain-containing protein n=1 Tax=Marinoscillum pacificum TaxID=392723 RepID=UPI002158220A|nr:EF-hand domain-containing protein [Marinoscillum pacificum]